jgi:hypothetical protein
VKYAGVGRQSVGDAGTGPTGDVEFFSGNEPANGNICKGDWCARTARSRPATGFKEIGGAQTGDHAASAGIEKKCGLLVDADGADLFGVAGGENARHEDNETAQTVAGVKVRIGDHAVKRGNLQETTNDDDLRVERISERGGRGEIRSIGRIVLGGISEFAEHGEARAGAPDGNAATDGFVESALDGGTGPKVDVVRLVSAGDENGGCSADCLRDEWIVSGVAAGNNERSDGIYVAERLDVRIVCFRAGRTDNEKVAAAGTSAEPDESLVEIRAAADKCIARARRGLDVMGITGAKVAIGRRGCRRLRVSQGEIQQGGDKRENQPRTPPLRDAGAQAPKRAGEKLTRMVGRARNGETFGPGNDRESMQQLRLRRR